MGLIFPSRKRRRSGISGLMGLILICVALFWALQHNAAVQTRCMNTAQSIGVGQPVCDAFSGLVASASNLFGGRFGFGSEAVDDKINDWRVAFDNSGIREKWQAINYRIDAGKSWIGESPLTNFVSSDIVRSMVQSGSVPNFGGGSSGLLRQATGSFMAGQSLMGANPAGALSWYQQGASTGQYGIMSQLKLGSLYMGGEGFSPNYSMAYKYNTQALQSLTALQSAGTPEAGMMLQSLPVEPNQLQVQLQEALRRLQPMQ